MEREALKLALRLCEEALPKFNWGASFLDANAIQLLNTVPAAIKAALEQPVQPAHSEWNAALDEAAARIGEMKGFGQATQDSFAVYIKGLKK